MGSQVAASAVFATNDSIALGVLRYCHKRGLAVPQQMSIVGMDNIEFGEYATTSLSSVNYDIECITQLAIDRVLALITANTELPPAGVTQIEPDLIVRESSSIRFATKD